MILKCILPSPNKPEHFPNPTWKVLISFASWNFSRKLQTLLKVLAKLSLFEATQISWPQTLSPKHSLQFPPGFLLHGQSFPLSSTLKWEKKAIKMWTHKNHSQKSKIMLVLVKLSEIHDVFQVMRPLAV